MIKQFHKASQYMSEKIGNENDKTTMDREFVEMERKVDITSKAIQDVMLFTKEYLQPNPGSRAKLSMMNTASKLQGKQRDIKYPQPEGTLGECMQKHGGELGTDSHFGSALVEVGEALTQMSEIKDSLDINVKQNFIDPLQQLYDKDIKEVMHHRKKLSGRRLDYDYKRKKGGKVPPDELRQAEEKLQESLDLADSSMFNLLSGDVEQVSQLATLVESQLEFHRQSADILESLQENLQRKIDEINSGPRKERTKKTLQTRSSISSQGESTLVSPPQASPRHSAPSPATKPKPKADQPCCKALFDFEAENEGELGFQEGDEIILTSQIDENWFEGMLNGSLGFFPVNYVEVVVPLP
ncbi:endophilin-A3-like isoform X1 [Styela clava]|uniref:endophilin-A3-like n=1 Tax=Styela clava TaxID=7725 RepID=UPI00193A5A59|nr:endophilin-A3-like [Styela clava]